MKQYDNRLLFSLAGLLIVAGLYSSPAALAWAIIIPLIVSRLLIMTAPIWIFYFLYRISKKFSSKDYDE